LGGFCKMMGYHFGDDIRDGWDLKCLKPFKRK